jgi:hypothetical protein
MLLAQASDAICQAIESSPSERPLVGEIAESTRRDMAAAGIDLMLFEKVCQAIDAFFAETEIGMSTEDEAHLSRILYDRFLAKKDRVTSEEIIAFLRVAWRSPRSVA